MNNPELDSILKKARLPDVPAESLERFPSQVVARLQGDSPPIRATRSFFWRPAWAFGLGALCVLMALAIGRWHGLMGTKTVSSGDILASAKFASETLALFPNRLRAIIEDKRGLRLDLSDSDNVPASQPLYVRVCDGEQCSSFVTFSGQEIQVAGRAVTVLSDPRGGIILAGDKFVWSTAEPSRVDDHLIIQAKTLTPAAM
jgi:hypothetical protein